MKPDLHSRGRRPADAARSSILLFQRPALAAQAFSMRDLIDLQGFRSEGCRVEVEVGVPGGEPYQSGFALIYAEAVAWAQWGLARDGEFVKVWNCISMADTGRFPSIQAAFAALPLPGRADPAQPDAEVLPFRPRLAG